MPTDQILQFIHEDAATIMVVSSCFFVVSRLWGTHSELDSVVTLLWTQAAMIIFSWFLSMRGVHGKKCLTDIDRTKRINPRRTTKLGLK
ncbi:hypothetical protein I7I48_05214 [Histoplasma ohiense]|nr:hypothetical protein I7I48_05214 [Histoplasma ohiense (nom. inval.)]